MRKYPFSALIDPLTSPYHSAAEIRAEMAEIERLPPSAEREDTLNMMKGWLEMKAEDEARGSK